MPLDTVYDRNLYRDAMSAELLEADVEYDLAVAWRDKKDEKALHRLINAYMRLAISHAGKFRRYGAAQADLVQEATVGLMKAAEKFDPDRGVRFSTYAQWWIKASIQDFVMRNYSMVRTGSTTSQKSLFFNMARVKAHLERDAERRGETLTQDQMVTALAEELGVSERDVNLMQGRLSGGDMSLNATQANEDDAREWIETLEDDSAQAAELYEFEHDQKVLEDWVDQAFAGLTDRERYIVMQRKMIDEPRTLDSLGAELSLSKERIRQIEGAALIKLRKRFSGRENLLSQFLH